MNEGIKIVIDPKKCKLSRKCMKVCPEDAIYVKDGKAVIDYDKCTLDGICIPACPNQAIRWVKNNRQQQD